jgi:hypothetical protein
MRKRIAPPLVFDGRYIYNRERMNTDGFNDISIRGGACGTTKLALEALMSGDEAHPRGFEGWPS